MGAVTILRPRRPNSGHSPTTGAVMTLFLFTLLAALAVAVTLYVPRLRRRPADEPVGHCRCPHCRQKLCYRAGQAGRKTLCPRCVRTFNVPAAAGPTRW